MPIQFTAALLLLLSCRWIYILAKRFDKPKITYAVIGALIYIVGGAILSFIATFTMVLIYGEFAFNYEMLIAAFFTLLGALSVGIFYLILRRIWKKQVKAKPNAEVLDDV